MAKIIIKRIKTKSDPESKKNIAKHYFAVLSERNADHHAIVKAIRKSPTSK